MLTILGTVFSVSHVRVICQYTIFNISFLGISDCNISDLRLGKPRRSSLGIGVKFSHKIKLTENK